PRVRRVQPHRARRAGRRLRALGARSGYRCRAPAARVRGAGASQRRQILAGARGRRLRRGPARGVHPGRGLHAGQLHHRRRHLQPRSRRPPGLDRQRRRPAPAPGLQHSRRDGTRPGRRPGAGARQALNRGLRPASLQPRKNPMKKQGIPVAAARRLRTSVAALAVGLLAAAPATAASNQVDIMFVYTPQAAQWAGNIQTRLNQYIAQSNQAYQVSGVEIALRMVHSVQSSNQAYYYTNNNALNQITYYDGAVHALRDDHGADFVGLLNMSPGGLCGLGWLGNSSGGVITSQSKAMAYSSSAIDCGYLTFTHELGHNMGLMHSRRQGDTSGG